MSDLPAFGAGIWHFATYKDRYATEGYGEPVGLLEQIDKAGAVGDLSVVDLNWPFAGFDGTLDDVKAALTRNGLRAVAITPEIYNRDYVKGSITNPDPARARPGPGAAQRGHRAGQGPRLRLRQALVRPGRLGLPVPGELPRRLEPRRRRAPGARAARIPDIKFVIEYKPREPRNKIIFPNAARTLLAIQQIGLRQPRDPARLRPLPVRAGDPGRRRPAVHRRTASCSPSTSTTTSAAGTTTWSSARCTWSRRSSSSTRCGGTTGRASGSSTSSRSGRTRCRRPSRPSVSSRRCTGRSTPWTRKRWPRPRPRTTRWPRRSSSRRCC